MKFTCLVATVIAPEPAAAQELGRKLQTVKELQEQGKEMYCNWFGCWLLIPVGRTCFAKSNVFIKHYTQCLIKMFVCLAEA